MVMQLRYSARSDVGIVRSGNEDSGLAAPRLLVVADGMGGHAAGELASATAVATFAEVAEETLAEDDAAAIMADTVDRVGERLGDVIAAEPEYQGMGTTLTALAWLGERLALVHVGDSRAYLLRDGDLRQITRDHTYVQTLVDSGKISQADAAVHPRRNLLMRAIDGIHPVEPDLEILTMQVGDRYLLCSDGLSGVVDDAIIEGVLSDSDPTGAVGLLVDLALEAGAPDNVTVVVADVVVSDRINDEVPVVVGAAGEPRNRERLPNVPWPVDEQPDPDRTIGNGSPRVSLTPDAQDGYDDGTSDAEGETAISAERGARWWITIGAATLIGAFAVLGAASLWWVSGHWTVGVEPSGNVALYRGMPGSLGPVPLQRLEQETDLLVADLPSYDRTRVTEGIVVTSEQAAANTITELTARAEECREDPAVLGCPESARP